MFIKKTKHKLPDGSIRTQIQLVESYRPSKGANPKQRIIRNYGYLELQPDPESFLSQLQDSIKDQESLKLTIDLSKRIDDPSNRTLNYAPALLDSVYRLLDIDSFLKEHRSSRAQYDLSSILRYLIEMQIIGPDSKRSMFMDIDHIYGRSHDDFALQHIYRALDEICELRHELNLFLKKRIQSMIPVDKGYSYLDITNFYFEKDYAIEGTLPQRGVSKEHRTSPIVQMGLLLDGNGFPIANECFPGNTSDSLILQPMIEGLEGQLPEGTRMVCVADKGLNSGKNIDYLCNHGYGYLFSQTLKGKKGKRYQEQLFEEEGYRYNDEGTYKWKLYTETISGLDENGKKIERQQKVLIYWSRAQAEMMKKKREAKVKRAEKSISNKAYDIDHSKEKYIKESPYLKDTGELVETGVIQTIDEDRIQEEERYDGYFCLITSEIDYDEKKIRETYHNLWLIENSFRIEKSDLLARAVYLQSDDHIRTHFEICHIALLMMRILQWSMKEKMISAERIQRVFQQCCLDEPGKGMLHFHEVSGKMGFEECIDSKGHKGYRAKLSGKDEVTEDFKELTKAMGIQISEAYMRQEEFNRRLKKMKITLQ